MKNVIIEIKDSHDTDGEVIDMNMSTTGTIEGFGDEYSLTYTEHGSELEGSITNVDVKGKCVTMTRGGNYNSELVIEQDKRHNCFYSTPFGDFMMGIYAKRVDSKMNENGGTLNLEYTLDFNSDLASKNKLNITVKEIQECQN